MNPALSKWGLDTSKLPPTLAASREPIVRFFSYHDAHPVAILLVLMEKFGVDWFEWEPATLKKEILSTFNATSISEHNWQKIQAVRTLTQTVGFWSEWHIFEKIVQSLNNNVPRFDITQRCTLAQLMAGVDIANQIREEEYDEEVQRYIAACAIEEGVIFLPPPLGFAQRVLSSPSYRCRVCGNVDFQEREGEETLCDFCTGKFQDERPLNFKPNPKLPDELGKDIELFLERDPTSVEKRFNEVKGQDYNKIGWKETPEDVQSLKLVVAYEYMRDKQKQLVDQLEELKSWVTP